ncbi:MAG TPA: response regulator [Cytophagaceae bacterium]
MDKVMIVEDNAIQSLMLQEVFLLNGYEVVGIYDTGEAAIESLKDNTPDVIIMDISLAGEMDGVEASEKIYQNYQIPVIFLTSYSQEKYLKKASKSGAYSYLLKPFKERELLTNVEIALLKSKSSKGITDELKSKDKLFSILSHDLRNHISVIKRATQIIDKKFDQLNREDIYSYIKDLKSSADTVYKLTDQLLTWASINIRKVEANKEAHYVTDLLSEIVKDNRHVAAEKKILLTINSQDDCMIMADRRMIYVLLNNFISNAIKFSHIGSEIKINSYREKERVIISVVDTGVGFDTKATQSYERMFTSSPGTIGEGGTGIGLLICKELAEKNDGYIEIFSTLNKGTEAKVNLPAA